MSNDNGKSYKIKPGPGRPKGSRNKVTCEIKDEFLLAFRYIGGLGRLTQWANKEENLSTFYGWMTRLFPKEIKAEITVGRAINEYSVDELVELITGEGAANGKPDTIH